MKPFTINVQITKCPKQYEAVRLGMECTLDSGETAEQAIEEAHTQLNAIYAETISQAKPQPAEPDPQPIQREPLKFGDPRITMAVKRMEKDPAKAGDVYDNMLKYFDPDEQTLNVLKLAAKLI